MREEEIEEKHETEKSVVWEVAERILAVLDQSSMLIDSALKNDLSVVCLLLLFLSPFLISIYLFLGVTAANAIYGLA
jgi:hypothetical protein